MSDTLWYDGILSLRRGGSPACPGHRVHVDAVVTVRIPSDWPSREARRNAAMSEARKALRALGLGPVMDLPGVQQSLNVKLRS